MKQKHDVPRLFLRFFRWYCHPKLRDHIEGDLLEVYNEQSQRSKATADFNFIVDVVLLCRPGIIRPIELFRNLNHPRMLKSYFKIGWRNLLGNKGYSAINIGGLAIGMTVAMFIGLWIADELSYNKYHDNYEHIGQIHWAQIDPQTGEYQGGPALQMPVGATLKSNYLQYFKHVIMAWWPGTYTISTGAEKFSKTGMFMEPAGLELFTPKMLKGTYASLDDASSIVISETFAKTVFGDDEPMGKSLRIDNRMDAVVTGVFEDIPRNNKLGEVQFFSTWDLWMSSQTWLHNRETDWDNHMTSTYVQLHPNVTADEANAGIRDMFEKNVPVDFFKTIEKYNPYVQIVPMSTWHLYEEFEQGKPATGRIVFVWLFGIVGMLVLLLACINFINLSTARSERRAREVGVRKAIGSGRQQLVMQFLSESFMVVTFAFVLSVFMLILLQPSFNELADKEVTLPFAKPVFWAFVAGFIGFTGLLAGTYPAFYLSSFQPARVLKGSLRLNRFGSTPRKVLVVVQFTVSVILVIGTLVVYNQVQYARDRPVGYDRSGLISIRMNDPGFAGKMNVVRTELLASGVVSEAGAAGGALNAVWNVTSGNRWPGKDPNFDAEFANVEVTPEFGKAIGWEFVAGRDFSRDFATDSAGAIIINEAAVKYMGLTDPIGQPFTKVNSEGEVRWTRTIIGVVKDVVVQSPYQPVLQTIYWQGKNPYAMLHVRINPNVGPSTAVQKIRDVLARINPNAIFEYYFVDDEFAAKFSQEQRVGRLAAVFATLAILISCLGLFGLASFVAEQRTKEIGIRKVMGASISSLWGMLSKDFVILVVIACVVAIPAGYWLMTKWLEKFEYRTDISWWVFATTCGAAIAITLLTVSYQSVRAAMMNPVNSLRTE